jgi:predicted dehydrogenase
VVVGFGDIAQKHVAAFRALGAKVVASANRSEKGRWKAEKEGGIERTYSDAVTMVEVEQPSAILLTASILSQPELIQKLIPFGLPMLVEKPPAVSAGEWAVLRKQVEANHLPFMVALNRRYYSVYQRALEVMGGVENVTSVSVEWSENPAKMLTLGHPVELLPYLTFATSIHGLDLLILFGGLPVRSEVWGRNLDSSGHKLRWQMGLHGITDRDAQVIFQSSWDVPGRWRLVVDAPGIRMVSAPLETALLLDGSSSPQTIEPLAEDQQFKAGFYGQAVAFLELVRDHSYSPWPMASLDEVSAGMQLAEALTCACKSSV